jgi:GNAT superfamily N-acetyltransferase
MSCVHIALFEGKPAGLCVVQINPMNGWSRLSFMGLLPAYRGLGLGQWLHRYGFAVMKREEGAVYHGGTDSNNSPMIRLFLKHKVAKCWDMEEWSWRTEGSPR